MCVIYSQVMTIGHVHTLLMYVIYSQIMADPEDINVLDEYTKDPRVVTNLIDGINRTRDDTHMWLTPYNKGTKHLVNITLDKPIQIAMMRIWVGRIFHLCLKIF
jgi:hypothetical protein